MQFILIHLVKARLFHILSLQFILLSYVLYTRLRLPTSAFLASLGLAILVFVYGFLLNDYIDVEIDRVNPERRQWLYVEALGAKALPIIAITPIVTLVYYWFCVERGLRGALLLIAAHIAATTYNLNSKRGRLPKLFAELAIAIAVGLLPLIGALPYLGTPVPQSAVHVSIHVGLLYLFLNSVFAGLKDIRSDALQGDSFVLALGCSVRGSEIHFSSQLKIYTYALLGLICAHSLLTLTLDRYVTLGTVLIAGLLVRRLFGTREYDKIGRHEYLLIPLILAAPLVVRVSHGGAYVRGLVAALAVLYLLNQYFKMTNRQHGN